MREVSVYYVPQEQDAWYGRGEMLIELLWHRGIFLRPMASEKPPLPEYTIDIDDKFADMGLVDGEIAHPVPNLLYSISCPICSHDLTRETNEAWSKESAEEFAQRLVCCPHCQATTPTQQLRYMEPMIFARFYLWVSDCDPDDWPAGFRALLEEVVGPCQEFWESL
jgi:hypothetical protein